MGLKIQDDILQLIRDLRPTLRTLAQRDPDPHRQLRKSLSSGSANESKRTLQTADAFGYVEADPKHLDTLDRIARCLHKLC
jgi:hypothetical protein